MVESIITFDFSEELVDTPTCVVSSPNTLLEMFVIEFNVPTVTSLPRTYKIDLFTLLGGASSYNILIDSRSDTSTSPALLVDKMLVPSARDDDFSELITCSIAEL